MLNIESLIAGRSLRTVEAYTSSWRDYIAFAESEEEALKPETFVRWRQHMIEGTTYSANTINLKMNAVKTILREMAMHSLVTREIAYTFRDVPVLKSNALRERRRPHARVRIEPEEMKAILETPRPTPDTPLVARDRAILAVLAATGMRVSEVIAIKVSDIVARGRSFVVENIMGKGQSESRVAPLSNRAYELIQDWLYIRPVQSTYLFNSYTFDSDNNILFNEQPVSRNVVYNTTKLWGKRAGMPHIKPHDFRRFVGTQVAKKKDVRAAQLVLGHKSIATTAAHYLMDEVQSDATEGLWALAPLFWLAHMLPCVAPNHAANGFLTDAIAICYRLLTQAIFGV